MAQSDFECNVKAEEEIKVPMDHLNRQDEISMRIMQKLAAIEANFAT